jgi:hypothetical protein
MDFDCADVPRLLRPAFTDAETGLLTIGDCRPGPRAARPFMRGGERRFIAAVQDSLAAGRRCARRLRLAQDYGVLLQASWNGCSSARRIRTHEFSRTQLGAGDQGIRRAAYARRFHRLCRFVRTHGRLCAGALGVQIPGPIRLVSSDDQLNSVPSIRIRCRMTVSFRATAARALLTLLRIGGSMRSSKRNS